MSTPSFLVALVVLTLGTYALRLGGVAASIRGPLAEDATALADRAVVVLLVAVAATSSVYDGAALSDLARPAGVLAGVAAALLRAPLVAVVLVAACTTALLRMG